MSENKLSKREIEVLELMKQIYENIEIATKLSISIHTVKVHIKRIFEKLNARNRLEAVLIGLKKGYIRLD